jgi:DNA polymerase I-like protein with 3'-5' exonuclease and polymerase domains
MQVTAGTTLRTMRNFPMQANGAEMLRLAVIFAHHAGVRILAPVHDAMLIEAAADDIEHAVALTQNAMRRASEVVLAGFPLRTDAQIIRYPDRFSDERGITMWRWMQQALSAAEETAVV